MSEEELAWMRRVGDFIHNHYDVAHALLRTQNWRSHACERGTLKSLRYRLLRNIRDHRSRGRLRQINVNEYRIPWLNH